MINDTIYGPVSYKYISLSPNVIYCHNLIYYFSLRSIYIYKIISLAYEDTRFSDFFNLQGKLQKI